MLFGQEVFPVVVGGSGNGTSNEEAAVAAGFSAVGGDGRVVAGGSASIGSVWLGSTGEPATATHLQRPSPLHVALTSTLVTIDHGRWRLMSDKMMIKTPR